ncbi:hypothetical protein [Rhodoblastus sp.]|uniref:hypothetical protein n=1 Tax=Rhodoblastus sp. TaxID=1962975 RepID=UPI003F9A2342
MTDEEFHNNHPEDNPMSETENLLANVESLLIDINDTLKNISEKVEHSPVSGYLREIEVTLWIILAAMIFIIWKLTGIVL